MVGEYKAFVARIKVGRRISSAFSLQTAMLVGLTILAGFVFSPCEENSHRAGGEHEVLLY